MTDLAIQSNNLTKRFGSLTAVDGIDLKIERGEIFGLLGPNGAGKTTSINMLCGLLRPDAGYVLINGKELKGNETNLLVGVCPQNINLWGVLTCMEQMEFVGQMYNISLTEARKRSSLLLEIIGLSDKRNKLASTLSGGMQRRLNLVMALVHDPEILVLDEPEAGLDPQSRVMVREYIRSLAPGKTVILTTHNMDEAERLTDRVAIMDHGRLLLVDKPEVLKRTIGEGDVVEIQLNGIRIEKAVQLLADDVPSITSSLQTITIRLRGAVDELPAILDKLKEAGAQIEELRLRPNSLEDVFITLTGRKLRE
jgi:ABC-2 type transport system ATP-binding protein